LVSSASPHVRSSSIAPPAYSNDPTQSSPSPSSSVPVDPASSVLSPESPASPASPSSSVPAPVVYRVLGFPMPLPGQPGAPFFDRENVTGFLRQWKRRTEDHGLTDVQKCERLSDYCADDLEYIVESMDGFKEKNWDRMEAAMRDVFHRYDIRKKTREELEELVISPGSDFHLFLLKYAAISEYLVQNEDLTKKQQITKLLAVLPPHYYRVAVGLCVEERWDLRDRRTVAPAFSRLLDCLLEESCVEDNFPERCLPEDFAFASPTLASSSLSAPSSVSASSASSTSPTSPTTSLSSSSSASFSSSASPTMFTSSSPLTTSVSFTTPISPPSSASLASPVLSASSASPTTSVPASSVSSLSSVPLSSPALSSSVPSPFSPSPLPSPSSESLLASLSSLESALSSYVSSLSSSHLSSPVSSPSVLRLRGGSGVNKDSDCCLWCDEVGHRKKNCWDLVGALREGKVRFVEGKVVDVATGLRLPVRVGSGGMKSGLSKSHPTPPSVLSSRIPVPPASVPRPALSSTVSPSLLPSSTGLSSVISSRSAPSSSSSFTVSPSASSPVAPSHSLASPPSSVSSSSPAPSAVVTRPSSIGPYTGEIPLMVMSSSTSPATGPFELVVTP
jgi:hypothetical protein